MSTGSNIKRLRELRGWSQRELGERAGVYAEQISRWERELNEPREQSLRALAKAFRVSWKALLG